MSAPTPDPTQVAAADATPGPATPASGAIVPLEVHDLTIAELVGEVYDAAPAAERCRLLEQLVRPLGVLSLVAVAGGVFAKLRFRGGWPDLRVLPEDTYDVSAGAVAALAEHVQQVSVETVVALAQSVAVSPLLAGSAAAALLVALVQRRGANLLSRPDSADHPQRPREA